MSDEPVKIALCGGINYAGADGRIPLLRYAEEDAQALAALLQGRGFAAVTLLGAAATRRAILTAVDQCAQTAAELCLLYFAGHGLHGTRTLDQGQVCFAPYDFDPDETTL